MNRPLGAHPSYHTHIAVRLLTRPAHCKHALHDTHTHTHTHSIACPLHSTHTRNLLQTHTHVSTVVAYLKCLVEAATSWAWHCRVCWPCPQCPTSTGTATASGGQKSSSESPARLAESHLDGGSWVQKQNVNRPIYILCCICPTRTFVRVFSSVQ